MNKFAVLGILLLGSVGCLMNSCSSKSNNTSGTGGSSNVGGSSSVGGSADGGAGDSGVPSCNSTSARKFDADGGLTQVGVTDPDSSVTLDVGGFYAMLSTDLTGYCYTIVDKDVPGSSRIYPPCGDAGPCFTVDTGLCVAADLGIASGSDIWGAGIGCNIRQAQGTGTYIGRATLTGKTSLTVAVSGCKVPPKLQVQLNMHYGAGPAPVDGGAPGTGYFCKVVDTPEADSHGISTVTVQLKDLIQNCWDSSGGLIHLDPETMQIESAAIQINSDQAKQTAWDFCVSKLSID